VVLVLAVAYLLFAFAITLTWYIPPLAHYVPRWLSEWMYPIDKTNLDVLRFAHFVALAVLTVRFIPPSWQGVKSPILQPAILCGQHSLEIFCLGVFLAFAGHFAMVEIYDGVGMQVFVSAAGIAGMIGTAALITWYRKIEGRSSGPKPRPPGANLAGGGA
jgi:hypothetical protein